jgi:hypothetical protein
VDTDPRSCLAAVEDERVVAFGMLHRRDDVGFVAFLFVLPERQGRGFGRALLEAAHEAAGRPSRTAVCVEADQPVATGLYAARGLLPRVPLYLLRGPLDPRVLPALPGGIRAAPLDHRRVAGLDAEVLGHRRPFDHAWWAASGRGWQVEDADGELLGYGYGQPSGRLGPVAARDPASLPLLLGVLARAVRPPDGWQVIVPGTAGAALPVLLAAGLRIDGVPAVYCADHPGPRLDRYLPASFALP